jgi:hypothetical protein
MGERRSAHRVLIGRPEGKSHLENLGVDGWIILKLIFRKWDGKTWTESEPGQGQVADACECGNEPSRSIKFLECLEQLRS